MKKDLMNVVGFFFLSLIIDITLRFALNVDPKDIPLSFAVEMSIQEHIFRFWYLTQHWIMGVLIMKLFKVISFNV
jgi:hypothetical protein